MNLCNSCPRKCNADRSKSVGYCSQQGLKLARVSLHRWEEPIVSGNRGSGTVFFSGCNLKCVYCQNFEISRGKGIEITPRRLAVAFKRLVDAGAHNINLVTPTHFIDEILSSFELYKPPIPIVYNCGGYESLSTLEKLKNVVDVFLPDFKYADNALARKYSNCADYFEICTEAILKMRQLQPKDEFKDGLIQRGLIIRHLVLPSNIDNTKAVLDWIAENLSPDTFISLMGQYTPYGKASEYKELSRPLLPLEYKIAVSYAQKLGFENAFIQDLSSASTAFIPDFDNTEIEF
ncbi:MAG: radical SAM protein [Clostridia bacterium]|nr:radical SAM protein [Clostridia bacterium]MDE7328558.1 radical SAM protein [Clostridia bacterium]